jgi:beta-glucosidase
LYHWDLPKALEDQYGGWQSPNIVNDFGTYASACFEAFGDRVKKWITINEPWTVAVQAYEDGTKAPGKVVNPQVDVYVAGHHLLLAHARAATIYKRDFANEQGGVIGISNCGDFRYPLDPNSVDDQKAAERAMIFQYAWFTDPTVFGDYPDEMKDRIGDRLPKFSDAQRKELIGSLDFMGLNHYSTLYAAPKSGESQYGGYWTDMSVSFSSDDAWRKNYMGWSTNPDGCRELLLWIGQRYPDLPIVITENGTSENEPDVNTAVHDEGRRQYFESYIRACHEAIQRGVPLVGYFAWSLFDNFEWEYGFTQRFGICYVELESLERTPKSSALWFRTTIRANGSNLLK